MTPNIIPTELEIEINAVLLFPDDEQLRQSYIIGVWNTIYTLKIDENA